jgi:hypothetical protein
MLVKKLDYIFVMFSVKNTFLIGGGIFYGTFEFNGHLPPHISPLNQGFTVIHFLYCNNKVQKLLASFVFSSSATSMPGFLNIRSCCLTRRLDCCCHLPWSLKHNHFSLLA